jgi:DNA polymerase III epsilon subunit-like protein
MNKYSDYDLIFVDTETTGNNIKLDEIIEIAVIRETPFRKTTQFCHKIKPTIPVSEEAAKINGYNEKEWNDADKFFIVWNYLLREIFPSYEKKSVVIGHFGTLFDKPIIDNNCSKFNVVNPFIKWLDLADITWPLVACGELESRSLKSLADYYKVINPKPHSAEGDVITTRECYWKYVNQVRTGMMALNVANEITHSVTNGVKNLYNKLKGNPNGS